MDRGCEQKVECRRKYIEKEVIEQRERGTAAAVMSQAA